MAPSLEYVLQQTRSSRLAALYEVLNLFIYITFLLNARYVTLGHLVTRSELRPAAISSNTSTSVNTSEVNRQLLWQAFRVC